MTFLFKNQLTVFGVAAAVGGALLWNVGASRAQVYENYQSYLRDSKKPRKKLTRLQAEKSFSSVMNTWPPQGTDVTVSFDPLPSNISLKSERELGSNIVFFFPVLAGQWKQPNRNLQKAGRPLVLVQENGGWGVDLIETYAKWNNLDKADKAEAIYRMTGVVLEGLPRTPERVKGSCQAQMHQLVLALAQYSIDYDEKLPPAKKWVDVLQPYLRSELVFKCPALPKFKKYGYAFNSKYSAQSYDKSESSPQSVLIYETSILKRNAYGVGENRAFRHQGGANYAFADGHVKWFPKTATPSFKLKP